MSAALDDELRDIERAVRAGDYASAEKRAAQAARQNPASGRAQQLLGATLHGVGQLDRAIACYRKAAQLGADSAELQRDLGHAQLEKGRPAEALRSFEAAMALDPEDDQACTGAAAAQRALGAFATSRQLFQRALRLRIRRRLLAPFRFLGRRRPGG
jgi:tetratricopeptide (TPR) repeat protein